MEEYIECLTGQGTKWIDWLKTECCKLWVIKGKGKAVPLQARGAQSVLGN